MFDKIDQAEEEDHNDVSQAAAAELPGPAEPPPSLSTVELFARRQQKLTEKKLQIAELSSDVMENPHENVSHAE